MQAKTVFETPCCGDKGKQSVEIQEDDRRPNLLVPSNTLHKVGFILQRSNSRFVGLILQMTFVTQQWLIHILGINI